MDINLSIFLISHHFNRNIFDQVYIQTKGSFMNYLQKPRGGRGEGGGGSGGGSGGEEGERRRQKA